MQLASDQLEQRLHERVVVPLDGSLAVRQRVRPEHEHEYISPPSARAPLDWQTVTMALHITGDAAADTLLTDNPFALLLDQQVR